MLKIWNYSKTPSRGVKDFAVSCKKYFKTQRKSIKMFVFRCLQLLVDDLLVYNGTMEMSTSRAILPHVDGPQTHHTVVFSDDVDARHRQQHAVASRREAGDQDVQLLNDRKVVAQFGNPSKNSGKQVDQGL